jgi:hypothetical protein
MPRNSTPSASRRKAAHSQDGRSSSLSASFPASQGEARQVYDLLGRVEGRLESVLPLMDRESPPPIVAKIKRRWGRIQQRVSVKRARGVDKGKGREQDDFLDVKAQGGDGGEGEGEEGVDGEKGGEGDGEGELDGEADGEGDEEAAGEATGGGEAGGDGEVPVDVRYFIPPWLLI